MKRQRIARLAERINSESKKIDEIATVIVSILKNLKIGSVLSEDEYYKILEYDISQFFLVKTGAEAMLEVLEKLIFLL